MLADDERRASQALEAGWDMLIVDEAHHLEWSQEQVSKEYEMVEKLASQIPSLLLLTGTPGQLSPEGHFARLRLLEPERFSDLNKFLEDSAEAAEVSALVKKITDQEGLQKEEIKKLDSWIGGEVPEKSEELLEKILDLHGTGRLMFRNRRANLGGFPEREALLCPLNPSEDNDPRIDWLVDLLSLLEDEKVLIICRTIEDTEKLNEAILEKIRIKTTLFHEGVEIIKRDRSAA